MAADLSSYVEFMAPAAQRLQRLGHGLPGQHPSTPGQLHLQRHRGLPGLQEP